MHEPVLAIFVFSDSCRLGFNSLNFVGHIYPGFTNFLTTGQRCFVSILVIRKCTVMTNGFLCRLLWKLTSGELSKGAGIPWHTSSPARDSAGCCLCAFISYGQSYTREGFGEVMQLFVHPEFQRKGLGSSLLRAAWRHMQSKEWSSLGCHVWCTKGNPANKVYEQVGWFPTGNQKSLYPTLSKEPVEVEEYMALDLSKRKDNLFWIWRLLMVRLSHCGSCCGQ
ncbi:unnamed protein product [Durusdinium trenchii]|uniref:N-acetyltransferase domain-containing protein n=1 Tax=Durusdinium trenchii TaxID=1381693 RepID=A0ABP0I789_9DINO